MLIPNFGEPGIWDQVKEKKTSLGMALWKTSVHSHSQEKALVPLMILAVRKLGKSFCTATGAQW